ncbi:uncharacterized protein LOC124326439 [Daphnia pulicaria]|uniref:uncharacterized protein LOC124326439 n=1 Tax=Daphnia pulicaria TaxID=35523 RepID=UPI001EEB1CBB|nr:uncharacterized protein LOC124326439 [Daphnia pulicaria]
MAFAHSKSISLLLIVASSCLVMISAEEEVPSVEEAATGNRQSKQIYLVPQLSPDSTYPESYLEGSPYELPLMRPKQSPLLRRFPVRKQQLAASNWPYTYPLLSSPELKNDREEEEEETLAALRLFEGGDNLGSLKLWKKNLNREATIIINPVATECLNVNTATEGLGPCKRASQANQGRIDITMPAAAQSAVIAITAGSPVNTRIRLICTRITTAAIFTQSGRINLVTDTPRTEIGFMQLVVTSTAADARVTCHWNSFHHFTSTFP